MVNENIRFHLPPNVGTQQRHDETTLFEMGEEPGIF